MSDLSDRPEPDQPDQPDQPAAGRPVPHGVPADQPPSRLPDAAPQSEAERQALDTVRSISRLEESND
jgi:hypothetical protein